MEIFKIILGISAGILALISSIIYVKDIFKGNTKPHIYTWFVWTVVTSIAFIGQYVSGAGWGALPTFISALVCVLVTILCLFGFGTKDVTKTDSFFLVSSVSIIFIYIFTEDVLISVLLATVIDILAFIPTMRKTWSAPESESLLSMYVDSIKHSLSIFAMSSYGFVNIVYPVGILLIKIIIILEILYLKNKKLSSI